MPGTAEHRMVGYPVLNAELAKPTVCQIDLHLRAQPSLRADRKHVAHNVHPDHQHRIDRRATCMRVVGCKLLVHPIKIENAVDLPNQMIGRHRLVEIERVEELTLSALSPPHHRPLPANRSPDSRNHGSTAVSTRVLQHNRGNSGHWPAKRPEYLWVHGLIEISCFSATDTELSTLSQNALRLHEGSGEF